MIDEKKLIEEVRQIRTDYYSVDCFMDYNCDMKGCAECVLDRLEKFIESQPPAECVPLSEVYRVIAGHSDYHGDNILAALTCIAAGKEVKPVKPLPADQWIPCSERLPDDSNTYEVTVYFDGLLFATNSYYSTLDLKWHTYGGYVTAWRERLPEPYKGE